MFQLQDQFQREKKGMRWRVRLYQIFIPTAILILILAQASLSMGLIKLDYYQGQWAQHIIVDLKVKLGICCLAGLYH